MYYNHEWHLNETVASGTVRDTPSTDREGPTMEIENPKAFSV